MGLIHVLDTEVSNKIAAGEVVEKPLSIVKELIENSIDAGASVITVEVRDGGIKYIRVTDNGSGMSSEDAKICFLRHATSKIQTGADLDAIYTLGFRGEALSSIGAVAKVRLYTKRRCDDTGICVTCEGGEILSSADSGAPNGTVMEVSDLFYNTPARLKFLKKPATEAGYIADIVGRYVFAHPEISFKLIRDNKEVIFSSGDNKLINAIYAVYGRDYAKNMIDVDYEYNGIRVSGVIGKGTLSRANRNYENFFVNKRYIKSAIMIRALEEAYKNQIMISKFPTAILNIEIDAKLIDINVHPTKQECKFSNENDIYQAVYHAAKSALYRVPNVPEVEHTVSKAKSSNFTAEKGEQRSFEDIFRDRLKRSTTPSDNFKFKTERREVPLDFTAEENQESKTPVIKRDPADAVPALRDMPERKDEAAATPESAVKAAEAEAKPEEQGYPEIPAPTSNEDPFAMLDYAILNSKSIDKRLRVRDPESETHREKVHVPDLNEFLDNVNRKFAQKADKERNLFCDGYFRVIGQLFETYILVEKDDRLLMLDQHAAHERLNYEALKREMQETGIVSQMMLEPVEIKLTGAEFAAYIDHEKLFSELGFEITSDGEDTVSISAVPGDISWSDTEPLFLELLTQTENMSRNVITAAKERLLYTISCKAAIKANMEIGEQEMEALVKRVFALENINTCPHGRPIVISMTKKEIEKDFKRIV